MESWSFLSNDETPSPPDFRESKGQRAYGDGDYLLLPNHEELRRKQFRGDLFPDVMSSNTLSNSLPGQEKSSNCRDSSFIDLKLGRFGEHALKANPTFSTPESNLPTRRGRTAGSYSQSPLCQVHGCDMDLSSSKDYHKRHRVCKDHSTTPTVTVNGIEQRFCQQCSRFHPLAEFDNGKRSCRKRLAGHNERRRKPPLSISSRTERLIHSYNGSALCGAASAVCRDIFSNGLIHPKTFENIKDLSGRCLNLEARTSSEPALITTANPYPLPKPLPYNFEKQYFEDEIHTPAGDNFTMPSKFTPECSLYENHSSGSDVFAGFHGFPGFRDSGFALSLLSGQPQKNTFSNHSGMIPLANNFSPEINSPALLKNQICEEQCVPNFESVNGVLHGSDFVHAKQDQFL